MRNPRRLLGGNSLLGSVSNVRRPRLSEINPYQRYLSDLQIVPDRLPAPGLVMLLALKGSPSSTDQASRAVDVIAPEISLHLHDLSASPPSWTGRAGCGVFSGNASCLQFLPDRPVSPQTIRWSLSLRRTNAVRI